MTKDILAIFILSALAPQLLADDFRDLAAQNWHQWRGPTGNGVSHTANPPVEWSETKNIKWKAWHTEEAAPYVSSPVLYFYFTKSRNGVLLSRKTATGDLLIDETRLPGISSLYASPVAAADRIYLSGRSGTTLVLEHGPEFEVLATNKLDEGIDASAALVGDELFLRGEKHLYCITARN